ncbi:MAG TPA: hypothetical protein VHL09_03265 [Dehalococcoidia bacterium]|nr:hypothetical protein [Dehalococcoidia bacterium]
MPDGEQGVTAEAGRQWVASRLLHEIDRRASIPGPLSDGAAFRALVEDRLAVAAAAGGGTVEDYRRAFLDLANRQGWGLADDGSNWDERWRALQAAGRRRARWDEIRDALEDLE